MPDPRPLRKAPITEALVDMRLAPAIQNLDQHLSALREALHSAYPGFEERQKYQAQLKVNAGKVVNANASPMGLHGYFFKTGDEKTIVQFRADGFTLNRLAPLDWLGPNCSQRQ